MKGRCKMDVEFKLDEFTKKMANDPLSVNMKEVDETRILTFADTLHSIMILGGEKIKYNHITIISDAIDKATDICNRYLLVMQFAGKQTEIPEDVINAIKFIYSFNNEKIMSMLDDESKDMIETMKKFSGIFGKDLSDL
jgi:hypothetical protein